MATIELMNGNKLKRKPRDIKTAGRVFFDSNIVHIYHAYFFTPGGEATPGLSVDKNNWIEAVKEDGKFLVGKLFGRVTDREFSQIERAGFLL